MRRLTIDFETANTDLDVDLPEVGSWVYAQHPSTEILCLNWKIEGKSGGWIPGFYDERHLAELRALAADPDVMFEAHKADFEQAIWANKMVPEWGMPPVPIERWDDTMARCYYRGLPGALAVASAVVGPAEEKDKEGRAITLGLSKPISRKWWNERKPAEVQQAQWNKQFPKGSFDRTWPTKMRVASYCAQDVETEVALGDYVGPLSPYERAVWEVDQRMNQRGLKIDLDYVDNAIGIVQAASVPLRDEFFRRTGGLEPTQVKSLTAWCNREGFAIDSLAKDVLKSHGIVGLSVDQEEDEDEFVRMPDVSEIPHNVRRVLEIRAVLGSASIQKLYRMRQCVGSDGRVRYTVQYHGAGTGRWAGRLFQPQNFPRGKIEGGHDPEALIWAINSRDWKLVEACYGDPIAAVASGLRHAIIASDGHLFNTGDYAGIEARIVLALASQYDKLELMASGFDVYLDMAEDIYRRPKGEWAVTDKELLKKIKAAHTPERTIGKNTILGCGFQMGWKTFKNRYCQDQPDQFAKDCINAYRHSWAPNVPRLWEALEEAALRAVWDKAAYQTYGITYKHEGKWLACYLPDGQIMYYFNPQPCRRPMPWDANDIRDGWTYQAMKQGRWTTLQAYGGLLTENAVQKLARGLLCESMHRIEANGLPLVLTVHDENMSEVPEARSDAKLYEQIMGEPTALSRSIKLPITVEGWAGPCYKK